MKEKLAGGEHVFGVWIDSMRTPAIVRLAAAAGVDFVFIDMEHSSLSYETVGDLCEMARACQVTPVVRPYTAEPGVIGRLLDNGAMGIMIPNVTTRGQVDRLRAAAMYPPLGVRGATAESAAQDYLGGPGAVVTKSINEHVLLAVQIESRQGIDELDRLLAGGGVDFVEVGRGDLSTDLGFPLETRHPRVLEAIDEIVAGCARHNVPCGTLCGSLDDAGDMLARGLRSIVYPNERNILLKVYREAISALRELARHE